ncbi:MAG: ABC transporter substrate-binding protein [Methanomassiliicoccales archaeon]
MRFRSLLAALLVSTMMVSVAGAGCLGGGDDGNVVRWIEIPPIDQKASYQSGTIDGAIAWEPYASDAVLDSDAEIYKWSGEIWENHPCCVMAVDRDYLEDNQDIVLRVLKAHMIATDWIEETMQNPDSDNYTQMLQMGADFSDRSTEVVESSLEHMRLAYNITEDFNDWMEIITQKYIDLGLISQQTIQNRGYDDVDDFVSKYVNSSLLDTARDIEPSDTILTDQPVKLGYLTGDLHQFARVVADNKEIWGEGESLFEHYGVEVTTSPGGPYTNGGVEMQNFDMGNVDIGYLGSSPAILRHLNDDIDTVIISQVNNEGSAIFVDPSIQELEDFDGKTIATPGPSSIQHLMFLDYFTENGFEVRSK